MSQSRSILAVILSIAVLAIYYTWISPSVPPPPQNLPSGPESDGGKLSPKKEEMPEQNISHPTGTGNASTIQNRLLVAEKSADSSFSFDSSKIKGEISPIAGAITGWTLKDFHVGASDETAELELLAPDGMGAALYLTVGESVFDAEGKLIIPLKFDRIMGSNQKDSVSFTTQSENLEVKKEFVMNGDLYPYAIDLKVEILNKGDEPLSLSPRVWIHLPQKKSAETSSGGLFSFLRPPADFLSPQLYLDNKLVGDKNWDKMAEKVEKSGKIYWAGLTDRYFLLSLISRQESDHISVQYGRDKQKIYTSLSYGTVVLKPGEKVEKRFSAYLGPKKRDELLKLGVQLDKSVDYGWFSLVALPILWLLLFFHKIVGNWGVAIILLTFFIKLLLHPVNKKAMTSMKEMQKIQPELSGIKEKFKDNREKLNLEMMALFKRHKVNPMGGCLPMVLQLPVYVALYNVLNNATELYHAPFFLFYKDLSAPDPFMISPILLGIFMFLQQKLTPTVSADPTQQKMMMIMPLMFSFMMIFLPFGLILYILTNTIMSVIQQYMIHREINTLDLIKKLLPKKGL